MKSIIKLLNKIGISYRLLLISLVYQVPLTILIHFSQTNIGTNITFAEKEILGNQYQRPLEKLFQSVGAHRTLKRKTVLTSDEKKKLYEIEANIDATFIELTTVNQNIGIDLQFTEEGLAQRKREGLKPELLKGKWDGIKRSATGSDLKVIDDAYTLLIADIRGMIAHAGDTSNLILDPDLDSYYLMDVTLLALPQSQDRISSILTYITDLSKETVLSEEQKVQLNVYASMIEEADLLRISGDIQTVFNEDKNFYGVSPSLQPKLNAGLEDYKNSATDFIELLRSAAGSSGFDSAMKEQIIETGVKMFDASFRFWNIGVDELDILLNTRIAKYNYQSWVELLTTLGFLVPVWILVLMVSFSVTKPLNVIVKKLTTGAELISEVAAKVGESSNLLAKASNEQASAVQETVASTAEMSSMISQTTDYAKESFSLANKVSQRTEEGGRIMEQMVTAMESIQQANNQLQEMANIINEISTKTTVINDIVFKTQLLSFNASIEAARAGQHGRGFAVVAEEVGNLAEMSGNAAKEIQVLLDNSKRQVTDIVESTRIRVSEGQRVSKDAVDTFNDIAKDVYSISSQIQSINDATKEQEIGVKQTTLAMNQMDRTSQENNTVALQASQLSSKLLGESSHLLDISAAMKILVKGNKALKEENPEEIDELSMLREKSYASPSKKQDQKLARKETGFRDSSSKKAKGRSQEKTNIVELNESMLVNKSLDSIADKINQRKANGQNLKSSSSDLTADDPSFQ
jgi:hypothetical protein